MNKRHFTLLSCIALFFVAAHANETQTPQWEQFGEEEGVQLFKKEIPGTNIIAFRGVTEIDAPASKIAAVLIDSPRKKQWVDKVEEAYTIKSISDFETLEYNHTRSGVFIVSDRDFVFRAKAVFNVPLKRVSFNFHSVEASEMPEREGIVRGVLAESHYIVTELPSGKTRVEVDILADPKGMIPSWIANLFQKSWPKRTLNGIRKETERPERKDDPKYRAILDGKITSGFPKE